MATLPAITLSVALPLGTIEYDYAVPHQPGAVVGAIVQAPPGAPLVLGVHSDLAPEIMIEFFKAEAAGVGRRTQGVLVVPIRTNGTVEALPVFDPSLRADDECYKVLARATVTVSGAPAKWDNQALLLGGTMETLFAKANTERKVLRDLWESKFKPRASDRRLEDFCLMRNTAMRTLGEDCPVKASLGDDQEYDTDEPAGAGGLDKILAAQTPADFFIDRAELMQPITEQFLRYLYEHCCQVHGTTLEKMEEVLDPKQEASPLALHTACKILGLMLLAGALATPYAGDKAQGDVEVERFSAACFSREGLGDCEDVGFAVFAAFYWIRASDFFPGLKRLLSLYECVMCTGAATNAKQAHGVKADNAPYICHVWSMLIPIAVLERWVAPRIGASTPSSTRSAS
jgi:hypothetical protein